MPYIKKEDRPALYDGYTVDITQTKTAGDLQYCIAVMIKDFMTRKGLKYQNCNDVMGALAGAQMEFYRKTVAPYEDLKIKENGDV